LSGVDQNTFFPRCYDLSDEGDFEDFLEDYKFTYAENYLKRNPADEEKVNIAIKILERKMLPIKEKIAAIVISINM
jgi:tubulin monoglycylase TTLL3/8